MPERPFTSRCFAFIPDDEPCPTDPLPKDNPNYVAFIPNDPPLLFDFGHVGSSQNDYLLQT